MRRILLIGLIREAYLAEKVLKMVVEREVKEEYLLKRNLAMEILVKVKIPQKQLGHGKDRHLILV